MRVHIRTWTLALVLAGTASWPGVTPHPVEAQVRGLGRIDGVVVDQTGAAVAGVSIETRTEDGQAITATTGEAGKWVIAGLGRGEWTVTFSKAGHVRLRAKIIIDRELTRTEPIRITLKKT